MAPRLLVTDRACTSPSALERLEPFFSIARWNPSDPLPSMLTDRESVVGVWVRHSDLLSANILSSFPRLAFIATTSTGHTHISPDLVATGIKLIKLNPASNELESVTSTVELTWALLLSAHAMIPEVFDVFQSGNWDGRQYTRDTQLSRTTIGIIGFGRIGSRVAQVAGAFGMKVLACDTRVERKQQIRAEGFVLEESLAKMFQMSRFISIHVPADESNINLVGDPELSVADGVHLVNTARGEVVDESAVVQALREGRLTSYYGDVARFENGHHELHHSPLWHGRQEGLRVRMTPHLGGASYDAQAETEHVIATKILEFWNTNRGVLAQQK